MNLALHQNETDPSRRARLQKGSRQASELAIATVKQTQGSDRDTVVASLASRTRHGHRNWYRAIETDLLPQPDHEDCREEVKDGQEA